VRREPFADPDRLALVGWSHGGWAVMDLLALDPPRRLPFNLTDLPAGFAGRGFEGVVGVALFYPYCALGNRARRKGWRHPTEVLFVLAGADTIVRNETCLEAAAALRRHGHGVAVETLEGVNHGFDDTFTYPGSPLVHDPAATERAKAILAAFLGRLRLR
jgi:dienelactone hydrolase